MKPVKNALILGASGDIGSACARKMIADHYFLYLHYHERQPSLADYPTFSADLTDPTITKQLINQIYKQAHHLDAIIITIGAGFHPGDWMNIDTQVFEATLRANILTVFNSLQSLAPYLIQQQYGRIVILGSTASLSPSASTVAYSAAKSGLLNLSQSFAKELAPHHVTVNTISPTWTDTKWHQHKPASFHQMVAAKIPFGRMVSPTEVAAAAAFFCSQEAEMITGQNLIIDGGLHLP